MSAFTSAPSELQAYLPLELSLALNWGWGARKDDTTDKHLLTLPTGVELMVWVLRCHTVTYSHARCSSLPSEGPQCSWLRDTVSWHPSSLLSFPGLFLPLPVISQDWSLAPLLSNVLQIALAGYSYFLKENWKKKTLTSIPPVLVLSKYIKITLHTCYLLITFVLVLLWNSIKAEENIWLK